MTTFADQKTKKAQKEFVANMIQTNDRWLLRGLLAIYDRQTADEQSSHITKHENGIGFSHCDAEIMSSFALQLLCKGGRTALKQQSVRASMFFSPKQEAILRNKMKKYAGQLARIAAESQQQQQEKIAA